MAPPVGPKIIVLASNGAMKVLTTGPRGVSTGNIVAAMVSRVQKARPSSPYIWNMGALSGNLSAEISARPAAVTTTVVMRIRSDRVKYELPLQLAKAPDRSQDR